MQSHQNRNIHIMSGQQGDYDSNHLMSHGENYLNYILNQLSEFENFTFKKMLGGVGFFKEGLMFATITGGKFRLVIANCLPKECDEDFGATSYYQLDLQGGRYCAVPSEVLNNKRLLKEWVEKAFYSLVKDRN